MSTTAAYLSPTFVGLWSVLDEIVTVLLRE
jgi:hypothetical protein